MTRDEAIKIVARGALPTDELTLSPSSLVDVLRYLGVLKIEEPLESRESPTYKAYDALFEHIPSLDFQSFKALVVSAGLKIVEK